MRFKQTFAPIVLGGLTLAIFIQLPLAIAQRSGDYEWFDPIIDVRRILSDRYVKEVDEEQMREAGIAAMVESLGDPFTVYVPPEREAAFTKDISGHYVGIGAEVTISDGYLMIVSPMEDSPALEAGVRAGDLVLEIEGASTLDTTIDESSSRLMGEPGTPVKVRVRHTDGVEEDLTIIRRRIIAPTIKGLRRNGEQWSYCIDEELGLSYARVTQFNRETVDDLRAVLAAEMRDGLNGLVLDLRDDPGGALEAAIAMSDLFLEQGTIVTVRGRDGANEQSAYAQPQGTLPYFPMIVLVNERTASASEIVSGSLQDNGRAKVLGSRTYGKGSVQEVRDLSFDRGTLKVTTALYYLPNGRNINRSEDSIVWGVDPDPGMVVPVKNEAYFEMLQKRRDFEVLGDIAADFEECIDTTWLREQIGDVQLAAAVDALRGYLQRGEWPAVGESDAGGAALNEELAEAMRVRFQIIDRLDQLETHIKELQGLEQQAGVPPLLPPDIDFTGGMLTVRDRLGNVVGTYRIEGGDLELAFEAVRLEPVFDDAEVAPQ